MVDESVIVERGFTNKNMKLYNDAIISALESFKDNRILYWQSLVDFALQLNDSLDGMHLGPLAKDYASQSLINLLCNPITDIGYCCSKQLSKSVA